MTPGSFSGGIYITEVEQEDRWRLLEPLTYCTKQGRMITVPEGFTTDFASIPGPLRAIYSPTDHGFRKASVIHDFLYAYAELFPGDDHGHISRRWADNIFRECMDVTGFRASGRQMLWLGVRVGGWRPWNAYRKAYKGAV